jgi:hydrogenase maturation protein HypF
VGVARTSSAGRLFDAVASLADLRHVATFEGQAAMALEHRAGRRFAEPYPFALVRENACHVLDWEPMIRAMLSSSSSGIEEVAARFHETLAAMIVRVACEIGVEDVVLSGGVFQNARLLRAARDRLGRAGLRVFTHQRVPPNDGGIAVGQIMVAACAEDRG